MYPSQLSTSSKVYRSCLQTSPICTIKTILAPSQLDRRHYFPPSPHPLPHHLGGQLSFYYLAWGLLRHAMSQIPSYRTKEVRYLNVIPSHILRQSPCILVQTQHGLPNLLGNLETNLEITFVPKLACTCPNFINVYQVLQPRHIPTLRQDHRES